MKKTPYIILLLTVFVLVFVTCQKRPEMKIYNLEINEESVETTATSVEITVHYTYPTKLEYVDAYLSTHGDMSNSTIIQAEISENHFKATFNNLLENTTYFYRFEYSNGVNLIKTEIHDFSTGGNSLPTVTTSEVTAIESNTARCGGEVVSAGNGSLSARGLCYSTKQDPTVLDNVINCGNEIGVFDTILTNLDINTKYYVRAFATNEKGTAYGEQKSFTTLGQVPTVMTIPVTSITANSAVSGGAISDDGGNQVIAKGVCWSTEHYPTINDSHSSDGVGSGAYVSNLTDLLPNTTYYVRAYATNSEGTGYGNEISFTTSASLAVVTTKEVTDVTETSAKCGGNVIADGGMDVTARGICWSSSHNPTISDQHTTNGTGTGEFDSEITGLNANAIYYVRAYATNGYGTSYGEEREFTTVMGMPTVTTKSVTAITASSASCGGDVTNSGGGSVTARGVCWGTTHNPTTANSHTTDGTGTGEFTSNITGLNNNTTYYVRAYATNSNGTAYGEERSFTTQEGLAVVTTADVTSITATTAVSGGNVTDDGGFSITARGVCWSTIQNPTTSDSHTTNGIGTGSFTSNITGLTYNTTYYVRAYATNSKGTSYGEEKVFTTSKLAPTVTTNDVTSITSNSAVCGGEVTSDGGAEVTARGVCWNTSPNPTTSNYYTSNGNGTGTFTSSLTGLTENTTYYVRAYAINSEGTSYGEQKTFTTSHDVVVPTVTTSDVTNISTISATCGGNVTSAGYGTVTARGVCWSTSQNPTISNSHTTDGNGIGVFTSSLTGLTDNTTYYVRAYATNEAGTAYGEQKTFTTQHAATLPTVTTDEVTNITSNSALSGGNVTSAGYGTVSAKGICWSTTQYPTTSDYHTTDGTGTGAFISTLSGLAENTIYYVRAYATNEAGTAYGEQRTFTTDNEIVVPTVATNNVTSITTHTATCGGNVTFAGYGTVTAKGVCWSTYQNPTINNSHTSDGIGTGTFVSSLTGLASSTTYYVRAYATNEAGTAYGNQVTFTTANPTPPTGAINAIFSVSEQKQVWFSKGNLQYQASTNTFRFAENQWNFVGSTNVYSGNPGGNVTGSSNHLISSTYTGWIDLFGWGTSGYNHGAVCYQPYSTSYTSADYLAYGDSDYHLYDQTGQADWGYNQISNGGNTENIWRTLTNDEWQYVIQTRNTASGIRYAKGVVNYVKGLILLPDNWDSSVYNLNNTDEENVDFSTNIINSSTWSDILEANGAVFLPAGGYRQYGTSIGGVDYQGYYWCSSRSFTSYNVHQAHYLYFWESQVTMHYCSRDEGSCVRLVSDVD